MDELLVSERSDPRLGRFSTVFLSIDFSLDFHGQKKGTRVDNTHILLVGVRVVIWEPWRVSIDGIDVRKREEKGEKG
jgi:hypothetical protein